MAIPQKFIVLFFLFGFRFNHAFVPVDAVVALFKRHPSGKAVVAGFAIEIRAEVFIAQLPALDAARLSAALFAPEFQLFAVNFGRGKVGDEVVFKEHAVIKLVAVRLHNAAFKRIAAHNLL